MSYSHTQRAPLHYVIWLAVAVVIGVGVAAPSEPASGYLLGAIVGLLVVIGLSFKHLTVEDEGDRLRVRFGPLALFQTSIPYREITRVEPARSTLIDGWGIHWVPGRGWTWNLWGFDCVELRRNGQILRIGTDDLENLVEFLRRRVQDVSS